MDNDAVVAVAEVVKDLTQKSELFSCFDVTRKLRDEQSLTVFHSEVRKAVHTLYADMEMPVDYERDDFALSNGRTTCVFHPRSKATSEYDPEQFGGNNSPFGTKTKTSQPTMVPKANLMQRLGRASRTQTDKRGRFCVSNKLTRQIGMTAGTLVTVIPEPLFKRVIITISGRCAIFQAGAAFKPMRIDRDDNLRLSRRTLRNADLDGKHLTVSIKGSTIVVE